MESFNCEKEQQEETPSLYALAAIVDDLKNDDTLCRLKGISKLPTVALAIGPKRTRNELLPFIKEATHDEDEVMLAIANQMRSFVTYVGGVEYADHILLALENILAVEESICREEAITTVKALNEIMTNQQISEHVVPLIQRCYQLEWFTGRCSVCGIFASTYKKLDNDSEKEKLREIFKSLCTDDTPMVRKAAASKFTEIVEVIEPENYYDTIVTPFLLLLSDDQDSVRVTVVESFPSLLQKCDGNDDCKTVLQTELKELFKDKSWRIRYKVSDSIALLQEMIDPNLLTRDILNAYENFLKDDEPEVRTSASLRLIEFCQKVPSDMCSEVIITQLLPCIRELIDDININVKCAIAGVLLNLSIFLDKDKTVEFLLPLFHIMLKDTVPDVRLNVLSSLGNINKVIGPQELSKTLFPTIIELADDSKWRVRMAVIKYIPNLASQLGVGFFDDKLTSVCLDWLSDEVYAIREETSQICAKLADMFDVDWVDRYISPKLLELAADRNYLRRLTMLFTVNELISTKWGKDLIPKYLPTILNMCADRVPNVRFNSVNTLEKIVSLLGERNDDLKEQIVVKFKELEKDLDMDVKSYATNALKKVEECV